MSDQSNTNEENIESQPYQQTPGEGIDTTVPQGQFDPYSTAYTPVPPVATPAEPTSEVPPQEPSSVVATEGGGGNIPRWFYIILAITLIAFIIVTVLLVTTLLKSKSTSGPSQPVVPTSTETKVSPSPVVVPVTLPIPTPDQVVIRLQEVSASNELLDIEKDLNNTDLSPIASSLGVLDGEMKVTSK